jgi:hypothetical protein
MANGKKPLIFRLSFISSLDLPFVQIAAPSKSFFLILTPLPQLLLLIPSHQLLIQILPTNPLLIGRPLAQLIQAPSPLWKTLPHLFL